ncbi:MAG: carboxypeptidase regulatory-like domain-containing protein [Bryobacteraceae bacterium]|nr:carboxypeptidase regulatory-like domain-containing protein [Bryobacteraceae bacterium]
MTVLDLNGGRITGVEYGSSIPVQRQLGGLQLPQGEKSSLTEFLGALRGAKLEVRSGTNVIAGRLLSVERKTRISGGTTLEVDYLALLTDAGDVRTTELSPQFSVRLLEKGLSGKVDRFLDSVSSAREPDLRRMVVSADGTGDRSIFVSYISEVPVWKSTYRIVLDSKSGPGLLQGWAIVDNTVGQDWEKVELSLVAGAPQSFIQNLSQPYYSRRPVVPLPEAFAAAPQTFEATVALGRARLAGTVADPFGNGVGGASVKALDATGTVVGASTTGPTGAYSLDFLPEGSLRLEITAPGFHKSVIPDAVASLGGARQDARLNVGSVSETVTVQASAPSLEAAASSVALPLSTGSGRNLGGGARVPKAKQQSDTRGNSAPSEARARLQAAASGGDLGDLFEYKLKQPITIGKNRSALVPIVQSGIPAEKVSIWNESSGVRRPMRALWLTNSTGLTLDGGSFSVIEQETFAGEGIFEPIRPGEKRLVSFAVDLALTPGSTTDEERQRVSRCRVSRGVMTQHSEFRQKKTYTFRNQDSSPRTVIVEHPVRTGYELRSAVQPDETTAGFMRFRMKVDPKQTASLVVEEALPSETVVQISDITSDQVALFIREKSIDGSIEAALRPVLAQKSVIAGLLSRDSGLDEEQSNIFEDQQRLRENMKALKGSAEEKALLQRYTQQLNEQETRLEAIQKEKRALEAQLAAAHAELRRTIEQLSYDVKL